MSDCGPAYDSHRWEWVDARRVCPDCGVEDLAGRRVVDHVLTGLREAGYVPVRPAGPG